MRCIYRQNMFAMNQLSRSELWTETPEGNRAPLLPIDKGYRTKLTITDAGYTINNAAGEVISRGLETEVFVIVEKAHKRGITLEPLELEINTSAEVASMSFEKYESLYGGADLGRTNRRKFKAYQIKGDDYSALGITEYAGEQTLSIASLYFDEKLNNREAFEAVGEYVNSQLNSDDYGIVTLTDFRLNRWNHERYQGVIRFNLSKYSPKMDEVRQLAEDAEQRQSSISEVITEVIDKQEEVIE